MLKDKRSESFTLGNGAICDVQSKHEQLGPSSGFNIIFMNTLKMQFLARARTQHHQQQQ